MRQKVVAGLCVAIAALVFLGLRELAHLLEMPFSTPGTGDLVTYGGGREAYESEDSGGLVGIGLCALILGPMLGWKLYHWIEAAHLGSESQKDNHATWWGWFSAASIYGVGCIFLHLLEPPTNLSRLLDFALTVAAGYIGFQIYARRHSINWIDRNRQQ